MPDSEYLKRYCDCYLKQSFTSIEQRDAVHERTLSSDLQGCVCWGRMQPYVCHYSDRKPLYSAGIGTPVEGSPDQCGALRKARLDRLNRSRTLESRRLIRAQVYDVFEEMIARAPDQSARMLREYLKKNPYPSI